MLNIHSQLTTPDGTVLVSKHRHDFVSHTDANGKRYFIDGGNSYLRCSAHLDQELFQLTTEDPHSLVRDYLLWGTYGIEGNQPLKYITLANMDTDHIKAVLDTLPTGHPYIPYYKKELEYRNTTQTQP